MAPKFSWVRSQKYCCVCGMKHNSCLTICRSGYYGEATGLKLTGSTPRYLYAIISRLFTSIWSVKRQNHHSSRVIQEPFQAFRRAKSQLCQCSSLLYQSLGLTVIRLILIDPFVNTSRINRFLPYWNRASPSLQPLFLASPLLFPTKPAAFTTKSPPAPFLTPWIPGLGSPFSL